MSSFNENKKMRVDAAVGITSTPTSKDVVLLLCENITTTQGQDGTTMYVSECPAHNDGKCLVKWKKGFGYSNPYSKLKTCFGGEERLLAAYRSVYNAKCHSQTPDIRDAIKQAAGFTAEEFALTDWLNMIIVKNWALCSVECKMHRNMCKHKPTFSYKRISMMIFILGEVVESKITKMLVNAKAVGLYDGFTRYSTHYVALYASFIEGEGSEVEKTTHRIILLGVSPMLEIKDKKDAATANMNENEEGEDDESIGATDDEECNQLATYSYKFDAEHHLHHFESILKAYSQNIKLFVAFISDNASVNRKTARLAGVPHLPCHNHTHALDVGEWCCSVLMVSNLAACSVCITYRCPIHCR
jgi:hypothetical protein